MKRPPSGPHFCGISPPGVSAGSSGSLASAYRAPRCDSPSPPRSEWAAVPHALYAQSPDARRFCWEAKTMVIRNSKPCGADTANDNLSFGDYLSLSTRPSPPLNSAGGPEDCVRCPHPRTNKCHGSICAWGKTSIYPQEDSQNPSKSWYTVFASCMMRSTSSLTKGVSWISPTP